MSMAFMPATALSIDSESDMSMRTALAEWPLALSNAACTSSLSKERAASTVWAPASARLWAMAKPIPRLAPATRAVLPAREKMSFTTSGYQSWNDAAAIDDVGGPADRCLVRLGGIDAENAVDGAQQVFGLDGEIGDFCGLGVGGAENASTGDSCAGEGDRP